MSAADFDGFLDKMWQQFAHLAQERVTDMETWVDARRLGPASPTVSEAAVQAAHKLAGALGSYQRPGSEDAAQVELLVRADADVEEVAVHVERLRAVVGP